MFNFIKKTLSTCSPKRLCHSAFPAAVNEGAGDPRSRQCGLSSVFRSGRVGGCAVVSILMSLGANDADRLATCRWPHARRLRGGVCSRRCPRRAERVVFLPSRSESSSYNLDISTLSDMRFATIFFRSVVCSLILLRYRRFKVNDLRSLRVLFWK